jgi:hypothetical protein
VLTVATEMMAACSSLSRLASRSEFSEDRLELRRRWAHIGWGPSRWVSAYPSTGDDWAWTWLFQCGRGSAHALGHASGRGITCSAVSPGRTTRRRGGGWVGAGVWALPSRLRRR